MEKVALFIDWDNFRATLSSLQKRLRFKDFNFNDCGQLINLVNAFMEDDEKIYRIYFYTAPMIPLEEIDRLVSPKYRSAFEKWLADPKKGKEKYLRKMELSQKFLKEIVRQNYVALRLGKLKFNGLKTGGYPDMVQKEVDMLLGLDISHVSYLRLAQKIMLFSKDTDIVPAMKTARINGLEVILPKFSEDGELSEKLIKHCDVVREKSFVTLAQKAVEGNPS